MIIFGNILVICRKHLIFGGHQGIWFGHETAGEQWICCTHTLWTQQDDGDDDDDEDDDNDNDDDDGDADDDDDVKIQQALLFPSRESKSKESHSQIEIFPLILCFSQDWKMKSRIR